MVDRKQDKGKRTGVSGGKLFSCGDKSLCEPLLVPASSFHPHYFQFANSSPCTPLKKHNYTPLSSRCSSASELINFFALMLSACPSRKFELRPLTFSLIKHNRVISFGALWMCATRVSLSLSLFCYFSLSFFVSSLLSPSRTNFIVLSLLFFNYSNAACLSIMRARASKLRARARWLTERSRCNIRDANNSATTRTRSAPPFVIPARRCFSNRRGQRAFIVRFAPLYRVIRDRRHKIRINESVSTFYVRGKQITFRQLAVLNLARQTVSLANHLVIDVERQ